MQEPRSFVVVWGDPDQQEDRVEGGIYTAAKGYPPFQAVVGDLLLLYCTENYAAYSKASPVIGVVLRADDKTIEYRWMPFIESIPKTQIDAVFDKNDSDRMRLLYQTRNRAFEISRQSYAKALSGSAIALWKL